MIVDHKYEYIYTAIPKTGSISIQFSLAHDYIPEPDLYHQGIERTLREFPDCDHYFRFAFVRNPWDRLFSLYHDFTLNRVKQYSALVQHEKPLLSEFKDFNDLCVGLKDSSWSKDIFFKSQTELLSINGSIAVDYVGRFENLEDEFNEICKILRLDARLEKRNLGKYERDKPYWCHYSAEAKTAIEKFYAADIENFSYVF